MLIKKQCAWCRRFKQLDGSWLHEKEEDPNKEDISHCICEECKEIETLKFRKRKARK